MALSAKQQSFVNEYLLDFNATRAAERAGYRGNDNTLAVTGYDLLRNPKIAEVVKKRLQEKALMADEVLMRLGEQARGSMNDFICFRENGDPTFDFQTAAAFGKMGLVKKLKIKTRSYTTVEVAQRQQTESDEIEDGDEANTGDGIDLGGVVETTIEFELYSSQAALGLIGKHHGLFDGRGSEDKPVHNVEWTVDQWREAQGKRQREAADTMDMFDDDELDGLSRHESPEGAPHSDE